MSTENSERAYKDSLHNYNPATSVILAGYRPRLSEYSVKVPLFRTSTFEFASAEDGAKFFERAYHPREMMVRNPDLFIHASTIRIPRSQKTNLLPVKKEPTMPPCSLPA